MYNCLKWWQDSDFTNKQIIVSGKKKDTWFILDPITGHKQHILSWDNVESTCPVQNPDAVYVGRTLYSIMMVDSRNGNRKWNVSFYDYSASPMSKEMGLRYSNCDELLPILFVRKIKFQIWCILHPVPLEN